MFGQGQPTTTAGGSGSGVSGSGGTGTSVPTSTPAPATSAPASSAQKPFVGLGGIRRGGFPSNQGLNANIFGGTGSIVADAASGSASRSKAPDQIPPLFASNQDLPVPKEIMEVVVALGLFISKEKATMEKVKSAFSPRSGEDGGENENHHTGDIEIVRAEINEVKMELHDLEQVSQKNERALDSLKGETDVHKEILESMSLSMDPNFNVVNQELCIDTCDKAMRVLLAESKERLANIEKGIQKAEQLLMHFDEPVISISELVKTLDATRLSLQHFCAEAQVLQESCEKMKAFFPQIKWEDVDRKNKISSIYSLLSPAVSK